MIDPNHPVDPALLAGNRRPLADYQAKHFPWSVESGVVTVTLNQPERRDPLTFDSYTELHGLLHQLKWADDVKAIVLVGAGDNFCSDGDVHEVIGPLVRLKTPELLMFTRTTGELVKTMRVCPQLIVAAIDGVYVGAGAILTIASDLRLGTARSKMTFLFNRVGLTDYDMGACAILPRTIDQGRASELFYTGRSMSGEENERWDFFSRLCEPAEVLSQVHALATDLVAGPIFANGITKTMLHQEWIVAIEQTIEAGVRA